MDEMRYEPVWFVARRGIPAGDQQRDQVIERHCHSRVPNVGPTDLCRKFWLAVMLRGSFDGPVGDGEGCRGKGLFVSGGLVRVDAD
jgi:hypothetical protein